uniref:Putative ribonuclease H-like domain-containing protein n=1 Tax=Tanacetum cinerariifolium TaxID=118510 RepID=A0A6L2MWV7_TANCI|nr:putative ribonuclease H-like domain-containing protein [Tanacetum cinerariifolium]
MSTEPRVDTLNFDDLYNNLRVFESDVKGSTGSSSSTKNVAFVSSDNTSGTNEVYTAFGVSTSFGHNSQKEGSTLYTDGLISKRNQDSRRRDAGNTGYKARDNRKRSAKKDEHKSMVTIDGEEAEREKEESKTKLENFQSSSKGLSKLLNSHMSAKDKSGLGSSDVEDSHVNDRFTKVEGMHAVPPSMIGNYMPPKSDFGIDESNFTYDPKQSTTSESDAKTIWTDAPIIEEYESDSDDEHMTIPSKEQEKPSFAFVNIVEHVKPPRKTAKEQNTCSQNPKPRKRDWNCLMSKKLVLTKTGRFPINAARQKFSSQTASTSTARKVNTAIPKVNEIIPRYNVYKSHSPIRRPFNRTTAPKANFTQHKVNTTRDKSDNPHQTLNGKGIVDSGCSRHMTGNKACLVDYQDFNGGLVAFGGSKGQITGKGNSKMEADHAQEYYVLPLWSSYTLTVKSSKAKNGDESLIRILIQRQMRTKTLRKTFAQSTEDLLLQIPSLEDIYEVSRDRIFISASYDDEGAVADFTNLETTINILVDLPFGKKAIGTNRIYRNKKDERGVVVRNKARLVAQGHRQEEGIDYDEVFAPVARIKAIEIFLAFASYMRFIVYQMNMKSAFLYGKIDKEVYVSKSLGFIDPKFPNKVYKVVKALYGLHQAPRAWYATLSTFLVQSGYRRGLIDKTLFIKKDKKDIMLTTVATSTTEADYVAAANCCRQVLWIQNQRMVILFRLGKKMQFELVLGALNGDQPPVTESSCIHDTTQDPRDSLDLEGTNGSEGDQVQSPHDSPLLGGHTSYRSEGALNLEELFSICTNLSNRVLALETVKDAQAAEIIALKARIKKLEKKYKPKEPMNEGRLSKETKELVSTARPEDSTVRPDMKEEKAKEKGVSIKDIEYSSRPARLILILKPLPTIDPKDKGKGVLEEPEPTKNMTRKIQGLYERQKRVTDDFKPMDLDDAVDKEKVLKELDSTKIEVTQEGDKESIKKRPGKRLKMKATKKSKRKKTDYDLKEEEHLNPFLQIVPDEKGEVDYEVLNKRFLIINWESKFYHLDRHGAECIYYKIFRSDGSSRWIKTFSEMVPRFDRMDLEKLYNLVMQKFETTSPKGVDLVLWDDIRTMFEETADDDL